MFTPQQLVRRYAMMVALCLAAGMLYWGNLVFKADAKELWGEVYWGGCAFVASVAVCMGSRELIETLRILRAKKEKAAARMERAAAKSARRGANRPTQS